jgi:hypothetical protein
MRKMIPIEAEVEAGKENAVTLKSSKIMSPEKEMKTTWIHRTKADRWKEIVPRR